MLFECLRYPHGWHILHGFGMFFPQDMLTSREDHLECSTNDLGRDMPSTAAGEWKCANSEHYKFPQHVIRDVFSETISCSWQMFPTRSAHKHSRVIGKTLWLIPRCSRSAHCENSGWRSKMFFIWALRLGHVRDEFLWRTCEMLFVCYDTIHVTTNRCDTYVRLSLPNSPQNRAKIRPKVRWDCG